MKCHKVIDRLSAWLDGELNDAERAAVAGHIEVCPDCRRELDRLVADRELLSSASPAEEPPFLAARVLSEIRAGQRRPAHGLLRRVLVPIAAALLIAVSIGAGTMLGAGLARKATDSSEFVTNADDQALETYASLAGGE